MTNARKELDPSLHHEAPRYIEKNLLQIVEPAAAEPDAAADLRGFSQAAGEDGAKLQPRIDLPRVRIEAFVNSPSALAAVNGAATDRCAVRSEFSIYRGSFAEAMARYADHPPPDLIIIEAAGSREQLEFDIDVLSELCPATTRLVVIGDRNDIELYRRLLKIGVSDYIVQPVTSLRLLDSLATVFVEDDTAKDLGLVIAFVGARGGVGSSTIAHNTAAILRQRLDATTLLIDADIGFGTAALQFDISPPQGLGDALKEREDLNEEVLEHCTHWVDKRFGILVAPERLDQLTPPDPEAMRRLVEKSRRLASHIVLDLPHGWTPHAIEAIEAADRVVIVATPDLPALRNARTLMGLMKKLRPNDPPAHLVLNKMPLKGKPPVSPEDFSRILDRQIAAILPNDGSAVSSELEGRILCDSAPQCEMIRAIEALAAEISGREDFAKTNNRPRSFLGRLFRKAP
jgi:pilus assembly protein CpaE